MLKLMAGAALIAALTPSMDRYVAEQVDRTGLAGVSVAITKGDEVVHVGGYGDATAKTPMRVASVTKTFTAFAVMQQVDQGKIDLDAPVSTYLPELKIAARFTARQLLTHTAGLPRAVDTSAIRTSKEFVAALGSISLGSNGYSNVGFNLLARVVEVTSGEPFSAYLKGHVFDPAGMTATVATVRHDESPAKGHIYVYGHWVARPEPAAFGLGSGGIVTNAEDMAKWLIIHNNQGRTAEGRQLLSAASVKRMRTEGFGWSKEGPGEFQHPGNLKTFTAYQHILPGTGYGIALLTDTGMTPTTDDSYGIVRGLVAMARGERAEPVDPVMPVVEWSMVALTALALVLGGLGLRRSRRWAVRRSGRPAWRKVLPLLRHLIAPAMLLCLPAIAAVLVGQSGVAWSELLLVSTSTVVWFAVMAAASLAVLGAKILHLTRGAEEYEPAVVKLGRS